MKKRAPFSRECSYNESISKSAGKAGKSNKSQLLSLRAKQQPTPECSVLHRSTPVKCTLCGGKKFIKFDIVVLVNGVPFHLSVTFF